MNAIEFEKKYSSVINENLLEAIANNYSTGVSFSTSFSIEDQIITHWIFSKNLPIKIFTLDTGRLFKETYTLWQTTMDRYKKPIEAFYPDKTELEAYVNHNGPNGFYTSVELRKRCCHLRKVEPLERALQGTIVWITGIRAEHSSERSTPSIFEDDVQRNIVKVHPLQRWTTREVFDYAKQHHIDYNVLHNRGFVSIGCEPCTRAIQDGESFRAGRWWWEQNTSKECGLHVKHES